MQAKAIVKIDFKKYESIIRVIAFVFALVFYSMATLYLVLGLLFIVYLTGDKMIAAVLAGFGIVAFMFWGFGGVFYREYQQPSLTGMDRSDSSVRTQ